MVTNDADTNIESIPGTDDAADEQPVWVPSQSTTLASLLAIADQTKEDLKTSGTPWRPGHEFEISGIGGLRSRERRRVTIVASEYTSFGAKNLDSDISENYTLNVDRGGIISIARPPAPPEAPDTDQAPDSATPPEASDTDQAPDSPAPPEASDADQAPDSPAPPEASDTDQAPDSATPPEASDTDQAPDSAIDAVFQGMNWGLDRLTVQGSAHVTYGEKMTLMTGQINRIWMGGITRVAGSEGVICGGAYLRVHAGPAMTLSALISGDVYGGCARFSGARVYIAAMHYRAAAACSWVSGYYGRNTNFVIEPVINSPGAEPPSQSMAAKAGRLMLALCPLLEIGIGVLSIPFALVGLVAGFIRKKSKPPPSGPPRVRVRNVGVSKRMAGSEIDI